MARLPGQAKKDEQNRFRYVRVRTLHDVSPVDMSYDDILYAQVV